jgi:hypothetical protein
MVSEIYSQCSWDQGVVIASTKVMMLQLWNITN